MKDRMTWNFRNVVLAIVASGAIVIAISVLLYLIVVAKTRFAIFVMSNFPGGTLTRIWALLPLSLIGIFALGRFVALRNRWIDPIRAAAIEIRIERNLNDFLPVSLAIAIGAAFVSWYPHYLFWPWWMDLEHFAMSAQMWDAGVRPYRDLIDFNFPGPIYVMWVIGKVFGWGRPMIANAIDGLFVAAICAVVIAWSRRCLGAAVPGLFAAFLIVRYYFSLDYARVMQRDWYVAGLSVAAICLVQCRVLKHSWLVAGTLLAIAGSVRPYAILAVGPVAAALWWECEHGFRNRSKLAARFVAVMAAGTVALWMPLVAHGIFDDFLRTFIEEARRGAYKSNVSESLAALLWRQFDTKIVFTGFVGLIAACIANRFDPGRLRLLAPWAIAFVAMLFYMPMCPVRHAYTEIPVEICASVASGIGLWALIESRAVAPSVKSLVVVIWFASQLPAWPMFCNFRASTQAIADLVHARTPVKPPPGCRSIMGISGQTFGKRIGWDEYQETLRYVRERTDPEMQVANFVWIFPFPAFNGPTGRKIVFPCAEGILWLRSVDPELELRFAKALENARHSIVIRQSDSMPVGSPTPWAIIESTIRTWYEPATTIGNFEIWVRKPVSDGFSESSDTSKHPDEKQ